MMVKRQNKARCGWTCPLKLRQMEKKSCEPNSAQGKNSVLAAGQTETAAANTRVLMLSLAAHSG